MCVTVTSYVVLRRTVGVGYIKRCAVKLKNLNLFVKVFYSPSQVCSTFYVGSNKVDQIKFGGTTGETRSCGKLRERDVAQFVERMTVGCCLLPCRR